MKKVFDFDASREPYRCDAACCCLLDLRFNLGLKEFLQHAGIANPDMIIAAGGAKHLASPERESDREFILRQIQISIRLHQTRRVILTVHSDCGFYGGLSGRFGDDAEAEALHQQRELRRAVASLQKAAPRGDCAGISRRL